MRWLLFGLLSLLSTFTAAAPIFGFDLSKDTLKSLSDKVKHAGGALELSHYAEDPSLIAATIHRYGPMNRDSELLEAVAYFTPSGRLAELTVIWRDKGHYYHQLKEELYLSAKESGSDEAMFSHFVFFDKDGAEISLGRMAYDDGGERATICTWGARPLIEEIRQALRPGKEGDTDVAQAL